MITVYHNARVYTGTLPLQEAFAVEDGRFIFAGSDQEAQTLSRDETVDLEGAFVCAGLNDSHMHLLSYGQALSTAPLQEHTRSLEDMISCLRATAPGRGGWIIGRGWNQDFFADEKRMPNRWDLDKVSTSHPVVATRACGHALAVNSRALDMLGVTAETKQVEGGRIGMTDGVCDGLFFDNAMDMVYEAIPAPSKEDVKNMLRAACAALNSYGVTSCQTDDYCVFHTLSWEVVNQAYRELEEEGALTVRVYEQANFNKLDAFRDFMAKGNKTGAGTDMFRIGPLKMLGDGALGARTAYLSRPYADDASTCGLSVFTQEEFDQLIGCAQENGMQTAVHCIGDRCLDMVISALENARAKHPRQDERHGIVHCQITRPDQLDKIAKMGLHVYAQSIFLDYDIHIVRERAGEELAGSSYAWKTLMQKGVTVSNGSDCPVEKPFALGGMQCAVTRQDLQGCAPYLPYEAFTVQEALDSYTKQGAYASFDEHVKGEIKPGMLADFTVLAQNPFETDAGSIHSIRVERVYLGGKKVYQA
ncbi:MAG: amidohydrolase [Clostridiales bacterium]|nr:amidohydrolase [Clostridiales bacterium]